RRVRSCGGPSLCQARPTMTRHNRKMSFAHAAVDPLSNRPSQCWCCGKIEDPEKLVHLGNHPEVTLCTRCAHWVHKNAVEIEDLARTGIRVRVRARMRHARHTVVEHGWHERRLIGPL